MRNFTVSRSATLLLRLLISTKDRSSLDHVRWAILLRARQMLICVSDPIVEYDICDSKLRMPLSHDLPLIHRLYPLYSDNLGRIAAKLFTKYADLSVIDIGANVGDSVAMIHRHIRVPVLCVEGEPRFGKLLAANVAYKVPAPVIEQSFVGTGGEAFLAVVRHGTARLSPAWAEGATLQFA